MALPVLLTASGDTIDVQKVATDIADTIVKRIEGIELNIRTMSQVDVVVEPIQLIAPEGAEAVSGDASKVSIEEQPDAVRLLMSIDKYLYSMHFDALAMRGLKDEVIEIKDQLRMQEEIGELQDADKVSDEGEDDNGGTKELIENIELHTAQTAAHAEKILDAMQAADADRDKDDVKSDGDTQDDPNADGKPKQGMMGKMFGGIMKSIKNIFKGLSLFLVAAAVMVGALLSGGGPLMEKLKGLFDTLVNDILPIVVESIMNIVDVVMPAVVEVVTVLATAFGSLVEKLMPLVLNLVEQLLPPIMELFNNIMELFGVLVDAVMPIIDIVLTDVVPPVIELFTNLMDLFMTMVDFLMPVVNLLMIPLGMLVTAIGTVVSFVSDIVGGIVAFMTGDIGKGMDMFANAGDRVQVHIANMINGIIEFIAGLLDFIPGMGGIAEDLRAKKVEFGDEAAERIQGRQEEHNGVGADKAESEIDFTQDRSTVEAAIEQKVADGVFSENIGGQLLERYDTQKKEEETKSPANLVTKTGAAPALSMEDQMAVLLGNELDTSDTTARQQELLASVPTTPAGAVNEASSNEKTSELMASAGGGGSVNTNVNTAQQNNTTAVSNITTGIISTGGGTSLGHRHRRVLPGIA